MQKPQLFIAPTLQKEPFAASAAAAAHLDRFVWKREREELILNAAHQ